MHNYTEQLNIWAQTVEELQEEALALQAQTDVALRDLLGDLYEPYRDLMHAADQRANQIAEGITNAQAGMRQTVATIGHTVYAGNFRITYNPGLVTWDNRALEGYAAAHPEILAFRRQGRPYTTVRHIQPQEAAEP